MSCNRKTYMLLVEYDGSLFHGWQRQLNAPSVQEELERALFALLGRHIAVMGAGRTDAGVHALGQICHFRCACSIPPDRFAYALNHLLPEGVRIQRSMEVPPVFHARYWAMGKHYRYRIHLSAFPSALERQRAWQLRPPLDISAMERAGKAFLGTHDFRGFAASGSQVKSTVRTVYDIRLTRQGSDLVLDYWGNGFLYNMVRIITGTLVAVGQGKLKAEDLPGIIAAGDRKAAGITAPPQGLYLVRVFYPAMVTHFCHSKSRPLPHAVFPKIKRLQRIRACHKRGRVFVRKTGKNGENIFLQIGEIS